MELSVLFREQIGGIGPADSVRRILADLVRVFKLRQVDFPPGLGVHAELAGRLAREGLELEQQGKGASARRLRDRFIAERDLSLLALKSFWEGFDAAGETLRCVVIPKLPFASPNDPLVREREARDQRAWWKYSLPEAVISVKQAAGRLIRSSTDTGVLVLADSRLVTKRYGRQFIQSLPSKNVQTMDRAGIGRFIKLWRASRSK